MTTDLVIEIGKQVFALGSLALASGVITSVFTEILKIDAIKIPAQRYPRATAAVISLGLSAFAVFSLHAVFFTTWISWAIVAGATLFCAFKSYDWILKGLYAKLKGDI